MLTEVKLTNFRIFDDEVTVRFRPITILIGRNSSGKSSVVKFLLILKQSVTPGSSQFLTPEGDSVHLGAFSGLKNTLTLKRNLVFRVTAKGPAKDLEDETLRALGIQDEDENTELTYVTSANVSYSKRATLGDSSRSLVSTSGKSLFTNNAKILDDSVFLDRSGTLDWVSEELKMPDSSMPPEKIKDEVARFNKEIDARSKLFGRYFVDIELWGTLSHELHSLRHLSAVRDEAQRVIQVSFPPRNYVGQRGQHTLPHLQQLVDQDRDKYEFILPHLQSVAGLEGVEFKTSTMSISQAFGKNLTTGAYVLLADFGFGVSQCLPVLVQGALMAPYTSMVVEQPEAQLHPTAQLELGSYFADLWKQRKVGSIIETHSDNILLRLRRLIARGELSHEDVSVAFFTFDENNRNMPIVKNLYINEDGSMQAGLPMEFFGADIEEGFMLGARE